MPDLAKQFSKEEIIAAIEYIEENQIDLIGSTKHLLEYNGNYYPPKEVVRWAAKLKKLENWQNYRLSGGDNTNAPLKALGFIFTQKTDIDNKMNSVNKAIINQYKLLIKERGNQDELYKFYLIEDFRNKWDIDAADFKQMFLSIDFKNLIYHPIALTSLRNIANKDPEFLRKSVIDLFDEELGLNTRVAAFCSSLNNLYKSWNPKLQGGIDERTVATLMTLHDPSKYSFYKWTFYNEWCKKLEIKGAKTGECYFDYLEKIDDLIDNYIVEDEELLSLHQSYLSDVPFKDENYYILAQDIIYQVLEQLPKKKVIKDYKAQFQSWLAAKTKETSNKVSSYMQALVILSELINEDIFKVSDLEYLQDLYKDLVQEQRKKDGKYYYAKSPSYGNNGYYSAAISEYMLFHRELLNNEDPTKSIQMTNSSPLNQILYGPPGTGKTYNTINKAVSIANPSFDLSQDRAIIKAEYQRLVESGQIVFTTFHQSMSYEDFVEGIKPVIDEDGDGNKQVVYEVQDGIFKEIVSSAKKIRRTNAESKEIYSFDDAWNELIENVRQEVYDAMNEFSLEILTPNKSLKVNEITDKGNLRIKPESVDSLTYTVSYARTKKLHEAFPDLTVVKNIDKEFRSVIGGSNSTAYWAVLNYINKKILEKNSSSPSTIELPQENHVLIIDEINRGNVSAIFGELITLIEDSKREGKEDALELTLPYSKEKFSVPPNLYIIGTMNTADRSVEALDTALRRRFAFEEMLPNPDIEELDFEVYGYKASAILKRINLRIEKLIDRDHCIGHAYFIGKNEETIIDSFYKNIIPLLQEYFFGDYGKIGLVLGSGFVQRMDAKDDIFAPFDYDYREDLASRIIYQIMDYRTYDDKEEGFKAALDLLMR